MPDVVTVGADRRGGGRHRHAALWLAIGMVALGVVLLVLLLPTGDGPRTLPVPEPGEVAAGFVEDQPVFVVHDPDGTVRVLDAVSPHTSFPKVLAWCKTAGAFEDLWHGSIFLPDGSWLGGPAPTGMAAYAIVSRDGGRVTVGARQAAPPRSQRPDEFAEPGPRCDGRTALYGPDHESDATVLDDLVVHLDPPADTARWYPTPARVLGEAPIRPADVTG
jgi:hypothetical protein